jgi:hypothetical protein
MWRGQSFRDFIGSVLLVLAWSACEGAASDAGNDISQRTQRGESFLTNLFDTRLQLLAEYRGSSTYWLFHDNYLAAHLLAKTRPDLSRQIRSTLEKFGVTKSGKIEIVFGEAVEPLPFRTYVLTNVASLDGKTIRTELVTTNILSGWDEYADLLLLASLAQAQSAEAEARRNFDRAAAMWDGQGFVDRATKHSGLYATYKLALYVIAADRLNTSPPHAIPRGRVDNGLQGRQACRLGERRDDLLVTTRPSDPRQTARDNIGITTATSRAARRNREVF